MSKVSNVVALMSNFSEEELLQVHESIVKDINYLRSLKKRNLVRSFNVGQKVTVDGGNRHGFMDGIITKIMKVNIRVETKFGTFNCAPGLLSAK